MFEADSSAYCEKTGLQNSHCLCAEKFGLLSELILQRFCHLLCASLKKHMQHGADVYIFCYVVIKILIIYEWVPLFQTLVSIFKFLAKSLHASKDQVEVVTFAVSESPVTLPSAVTEEAAHSPKASSFFTKF